MKTIILLRGLPGAGKSTLAKTLGGLNIEADMYFIDAESGDYKFNASDLTRAHRWCQDVVEHWMQEEEEKIVVSNTFTQEWEMVSYFNLAEKYGYMIHSVIVENRHGGVNVHGVPEQHLEKMRERFNVKL